ncbi:MAG TPA: DUF3467 domain-containing protein [Anaerolineales bacterium]|nr:DUF3467 domain-containing protein [Anaerolineales bacterium]
MTTPAQPAPTPPPGPKIHLREGMEPLFTNLARITHSPTEYIIDFGRMFPGETMATINARMVMTPFSAKLLMRALAENLARYETAFGEIKVPGNSLADNLFRNLQPPEPTKE